MSETPKYCLHLNISHEYVTWTLARKNTSSYKTQAEYWTRECLDLHLKELNWWKALKVMLNEK